MTAGSTPRLIRRLMNALLLRRREAMKRSAAAAIHTVLAGNVVSMLDVGASGGILPRWHAFRNDIAFIGLEPDERSSKALLESPEASDYRSYRIIPWGAWSHRGNVGISFTRKPMCSSHFLPNMAFLARFEEVDRYDVVSAGQVECQTIDSLLANATESVDFIKLDLEGGEIEVLRGADRVLDRCLGLHVEVSFQSLRSGQPLFGDVSAYLNEKDLEFVDFVALIRWERDAFRGAGQSVIGDALFLRSPESLAAWIGADATRQAKARSYLAILLIYERYDLGLRFLDLLERSGLPLDADYVRAVRAVFTDRRRSFAKRLKAAEMLGAVVANSGARDSSFHYLY